MKQEIDVFEGEVKINFKEAVAGKVSLSDLGLTDEQVVLEGGFLRLVFNLNGIGKHQYFAVPTLEISYKESVAETHWQCEFNEQTIIDKTDNHGNTTVILLDRTKLSKLEHHHENELVVHGEFPASVSIDTKNSYIQLFK